MTENKPVSKTVTPPTLHYPTKQFSENSRETKKPELQQSYTTQKIWQSKKKNELNPHPGSGGKECVLVELEEGFER